MEASMHRETTECTDIGMRDVGMDGLMDGKRL